MNQPGRTMGSVGHVCLRRFGTRASLTRSLRHGSRCKGSVSSKRSMPQVSGKVCMTL